MGVRFRIGCRAAWLGRLVCGACLLGTKKAGVGLMAGCLVGFAFGKRKGSFRTFIAGAGMSWSKSWRFMSGLRFWKLLLSGCCKEEVGKFGKPENGEVLGGENPDD